MSNDPGAPNHGPANPGDADGPGGEDPLPGPLVSTVGAELPLASYEEKWGFSLQELQHATKVVTRLFHDPTLFLGDPYLAESRLYYMITRDRRTKREHAATLKQIQNESSSRRGRERREKDIATIRKTTMKREREEALNALLATQDGAERYIEDYKDSTKNLSDEPCQSGSILLVEAQPPVGTAEGPSRPVGREAGEMDTVTGGPGSGDASLRSSHLTPGGTGGTLRALLRDSIKEQQRFQKRCLAGAEILEAVLDPVALLPHIIPLDRRLLGASPRINDACSIQLVYADGSTDEMSAANQKVAAKALFSLSDIEGWRCHLTSLFHRFWPLSEYNTQMVHSFACPPLHRGEETARDPLLVLNETITTLLKDCDAQHPDGLSLVGINELLARQQAQVDVLRATLLAADGAAFLSALQTGCARLFLFMIVVYNKLRLPDRGTTFSALSFFLSLSWDPQPAVVLPHPGGAQRGHDNAPSDGATDDDGTALWHCRQRAEAFDPVLYILSSGNLASEVSQSFESSSFYLMVCAAFLGNQWRIASGTRNEYIRAKGDDTLHALLAEERYEEQSRADAEPVSASSLLRGLLAVRCGPIGANIAILRHNITRSSSPGGGTGPGPTLYDYLAKLRDMCYYYCLAHAIIADDNDKNNTLGASGDEDVTQRVKGQAAVSAYRALQELIDLHDGTCEAYELRDPLRLAASRLYLTWWYLLSLYDIITRHHIYHHYHCTVTKPRVPEQDADAPVDEGLGDIDADDVVGAVEDAEDGEFEATRLSGVAPLFSRRAYQTVNYIMMTLFASVTYTARQFAFPAKTRGEEDCVAPPAEEGGAASAMALDVTDGCGYLFNGIKVPPPTGPPEAEDDGGVLNEEGVFEQHYLDITSASMTIGASGRPQLLGLPYQDAMLFAEPFSLQSPTEASPARNPNSELKQDDASRENNAIVMLTRETSEELRLTREIKCHTCKGRYSYLHPYYYALCRPCGEYNYNKRLMARDLRGKNVLLTGCRIKIGYAMAVSLLRCGATMIGTTRFVHDAISRFQQEPDYPAWKHRLHLFSIDLRDMWLVTQFCGFLSQHFGSLFAIINNAAQTIARTPEYTAVLRRGEAHPSPHLHAALLSDARAAEWYNYFLQHSSVTVGHSLALEYHPTNNPIKEDDAGAGGADAGALQLAVLNRNNIDVFSSEGDASNSDVAVTVISRPPIVDRYDTATEDTDRRNKNSWTMQLHEVTGSEAAEVMAINALSPFILNSKLKPLLMRREGGAIPSPASTPRDPVEGLGAEGASDEAALSNRARKRLAAQARSRDHAATHAPQEGRFIINVSAMEGQFYRFKQTTHPHTNMAKAALNMMTRTSAGDYAQDGIYMNAVDTGWITDESPYDKRLRRAAGHQLCPLDEVDAAARCLDLIYTDSREYGKFWKNFKVIPW